MYRPRRGLGDVINLDAANVARGSAYSDVLNLPGTVKASWCLLTGWCSKESMEAAAGLLHPDVVYPPLPAPKGTPGAPVTGTPADPCAGKIGADYYVCTATTPNTMVADQMRADQAATQNYFVRVGSGLDEIGDGGSGKPGLSTTALLGIGLLVALGVVGAVSGAKGRR